VGELAEPLLCSNYDNEARISRSLDGAMRPASLTYALATDDNIASSSVMNSGAKFKVSIHTMSLAIYIMMKEMYIKY
jgi:hypothetical protein